MAGPLPDDRTRDCHHLGIEVALNAAELWCPNIACSAQCEQRHSDTARLYHDDALAPAEGEAPEPDDSGIGHCRADHPERLDRDRTIGIEIIRAVEIPSGGTNFSKIDHLRAFDIERLQLLGGEGDEFAAGVFVSLDHLTLVDLLASCGIMRPKRDPGGCGALVSIKAGIVDEEPRCRRWWPTVSLATSIGTKTANRRHDCRRTKGREEKHPGSVTQGRLRLRCGPGRAPDNQGNGDAQYNQNGAKNDKALTCAPVVGNDTHCRRDYDCRQPVHGLPQPDHRTLTVWTNGFRLHREHHRLDDPLQPAA